MFSNKEQIIGYYTELNLCLTQLSQLLGQERQAIIDRDATALARIGEQKAVVCDQLSEFGQTKPGIAEFLTWVPERWRDEFDADHKKLVDLAEATRDYNLVNGKILLRSQQFAREMLNIMSGKTHSGVGGLYGQSGQQADFDAQSKAVVKA